MAGSPVGGVTNNASGQVATWLIGAFDAAGGNPISGGAVVHVGLSRFASNCPWMVWGNVMG
jgi:hypothetical protein